MAFENPTYLKAYRIFELFSGQAVTVPSDEGGIRAKDLEEVGAKAVYVMPSHQYPSGRIMPIGRRLELLHWAMGGAKRYVIEDDYDSEFRYRGKPVPSLQASDTAGKGDLYRHFLQVDRPGDPGQLYGSAQKAPAPV